VGSDSTSSTSNETNNLAMDASLTNGEGALIFDSIITDASDELVKETIQQHRATFDVLMSQSTIQLEGLLDMGRDIITLADENQIRLEGFAYQQLANGVRFLEVAKEQGKFVIDFADRQAARAFELAEGSQNNNTHVARAALDIAADVKTGDQLEMVQTVAALIVVFGLGGLYLLTRNGS